MSSCPFPPLPSSPFSLTNPLGTHSQFLESLCDNLYDSLRPRILHEPKLETLCELCTVLSAMMALDSQSLGDADGDSDDEDAPAEGRMGIGRLRFSVLLRTIQQDAQTRLVFRAQAVIQSDVLHFAPSAEDLKYPEKVEALGEKGLMLWTEDERLRDLEAEKERDGGKEGGKQGGGFRVPREEVQGSWYPTLKRTVWVLSRLNTYVNVGRLALSFSALSANADLLLLLSLALSPSPSHSLSLTPTITERHLRGFRRRSSNPLSSITLLRLSPHLRPLPTGQQDRRTAVPHPPFAAPEGDD